VRKKSVEVRNDDKGGIDEIIVKDALVHIERMSNAGWFLGISPKDGSFWQFWFGAKNGRSHVEFTHTEHTPAEEMDRLRAGRAP
jgi:hypothetical protein